MTAEGRDSWGQVCHFATIRGAATPAPRRQKNKSWAYASNNHGDGESAGVLPQPQYLFLGRS